MFTGIVQDIGEIVSVEKLGDWKVAIKVPHLPLDRLAVGGSMACSGICLTAVEIVQQTFWVQLSMETLSKTTAIHWKVGQRINLEPALRFGDELGGHLLTGHVDGVAYLIDRRKDADSIRCRFEAPNEFVRFLAPKGSVALDGVSLTVNEVMGREFGVNIIPHSQKHTTFGELDVGSAVNFEADMIVRYVDRIMGARAREASLNA